MKRYGLAAFAFSISFSVLPRTSAAGDRIDPCTLLSQQQAASVFGAPLDPGTYTAPTCIFHGAGGDTNKILMVMVVGGDSVPPGQIPRMYAGMLQHEPGAKPEPYAGLGEQASFLTHGSDGLRLQVLYHNRIVSLGALASPNPDLKAALVAAMRQILQKL